MWAGRFITAKRRGKWEYVGRARGIRAAVILAIDDGHVLLVDQYRVPLGRRCIELPAGLVGDHDADEDAGIAASRELEEETGLSLGNPPNLGGLDYLCRATTPPSQPIRFDARFFVVDATEVSGTLAGSGELENLRDYTVAEALELDLAFATRSVLQRLLDWLDMTPEARAARRTTPAMQERVWREE
jgi:8-oxo-dGTP pyrophosphatase MutT (NUDIX family)